MAKLKVTVTATQNSKATEIKIAGQKKGILGLGYDGEGLLSNVEVKRGNLALSDVLGLFHNRTAALRAQTEEQPYSNSNIVAVVSGVETQIIYTSGKGSVERIVFFTDHRTVEFHFYIDGSALDAYVVMPNNFVTALDLNDRGYDKTTYPVQVLKYFDNPLPADDGVYEFNILIPFKFKRSFEIRAYHTTGIAQAVRIGIICNLLI